MSQPFVGEIRMFGGSFAPAGWAFCNGQLMPISENETLFNLIGTTYGGDGQSTFGIPDLQGRVPVHAGTGAGSTYVVGEKAGVESVTVTTQQMPTHNHSALAASTGQVASPAGGVLATATSTQTGMKIYSTVVTPNTPISPSSITPAGGSQPHNNIQQTLAVSYIISLFGIFPHQ